MYAKSYYLLFNIVEIVVKNKSLDKTVIHRILNKIQVITK